MHGSVMLSCVTEELVAVLLQVEASEDEELLPDACSSLSATGSCTSEFLLDLRLRLLPELSVSLLSTTAEGSLLLAGPVHFDL